MDADAVEAAVIGALADFYRHQHALIADAIIKANVGLTPKRTPGVNGQPWP